MVVAICLFYDTFLSGVILSNYRFHLGENDNFMDQQNAFLIICFIQTVDIVLNFLKIEITPTSKIDNPGELFSNYFGTPFFVDVIAVIPYSLLGMSNYIFLRFLKLLEFAKYLSYFTEFVLFFAQSFINTEQ